MKLKITNPILISSCSVPINVYRTLKVQFVTIVRLDKTSNPILVHDQFPLTFYREQIKVQFVTIVSLVSFTVLGSLSEVNHETLNKYFGNLKYFFGYKKFNIIWVLMGICARGKPLQLPYTNEAKF